MDEKPEDNIEKESKPASKSRAFQQIEERLEKRRRRASISRLIFYIIALIAIIFLMIWLKRAGM